MIGFGPYNQFAQAILSKVRTIAAGLALRRRWQVVAQADPLFSPRHESSENPFTQN